VESRESVKRESGKRGKMPKKEKQDVTGAKKRTNIKRKTALNNCPKRERSFPDAQVHPESETRTHPVTEGITGKG